MASSEELLAGRESAQVAKDNNNNKSVRLFRGASARGPRVRSGRQGQQQSVRLFRGASARGPRVRSGRQGQQQQQSVPLAIRVLLRASVARRNTNRSAVATRQRRAV